MDCIDPGRSAMLAHTQIAMLCRIGYDFYGTTSACYVAIGYRLDSNMGYLLAISPCRCHMYLAYRCRAENQRVLISISFPTLVTFYVNLLMAPGVSSDVKYLNWMQLQWLVFANVQVRQFDK